MSESATIAKYVCQDALHRACNDVVGTPNHSKLPQAHQKTRTDAPHMTLNRKRFNDVARVIHLRSFYVVRHLTQDGIRGCGSCPTSIKAWLAGIQSPVGLLHTCALYIIPCPKQLHILAPWPCLISSIFLPRANVSSFLTFPASNKNSSERLSLMVFCFPHKRHSHG